MQDARAWLDGALAVLRERKAREPRPDIRCLRQDWGPMRLGRAVTGAPFRLNGKDYAPPGLGTHADSVIEVTLPGPGRRLTGFAGVDDHPQARQHALPLVFRVEAGGKELWRSGEQRVDMEPARVDAELAGARAFRLMVQAPGYGCAPANWVELQATLADGRRIPIGAPAPPDHACVGFTYGGQPWDDLRGAAVLAEEELPGTADYALRRLTQTADDGLQVILEFRAYRAFPAVEWTARFRNTGRRATPVLEAIRSLDLTLPGGAILHHFRGDDNTAEGYEPHTAELKAGCRLEFAPVGGRPTNRSWPYYNLEYPARQRGVFIVVGWAGQWAACFQHDAGYGLTRVTAGQELTHFTLLPGEEVRAPLSVLLFWHGDRLRSHNLWRRWMMACNLPRPGGRLPAPFLAANWGSEMHRADESSQLAFLERYAAERIPLDYWWMDAGWYPCAGDWGRTGTWEVDRRRFPRGLRAISDYACAQGLKSIVWFEPERVHPGTWLDQRHPEWLLACDPAGERHWSSGDKLFNLGDPDARRWLTDQVTHLIQEEGVALYRQDFNFNPLPYWRAHDAPDRQGITEIRYVEGYFAYWTALQERFPDMPIDSCAAGGRRNDLETVRRAIPLTKTDYDYADQPTKHAFHHSLFLWLPFFGAGVMPLDQVDPYAVRSAFAPMTALGYDVRRPDIDYALLRRLLDEWREIAAFYYADYYPLTPYNRTEDAWIAWQFHDPERDAGVVQVFSRAANPYESARFKLRGLNGRTRYRVTDRDRPENGAGRDGRDLMENGLPVAVTRKPQAIVMTYRAE